MLYSKGFPTISFSGSERFYMALAQGPKVYFIGFPKVFQCFVALLCFFGLARGAIAKSKKRSFQDQFLERLQMFNGLGSKASGLVPKELQGILYMSPKILHGLGSRSLWLHSKGFGMNSFGCSSGFKMALAPGP